MVSGSISPPCSGYFSPFPHGTGSLSVSEECLALADGAARFRRDSSGPALLRVSKQALIVPVRGSHPLWPAFPCSSSPINTLKIRPYNPQTAVTVRVWAGPCSLATTYGITIVFFSSGYLDVSVHRVCLRCRILYLQYRGLPHSESLGSMPMCGYPKTIAACRVLHRLSEPRHPPCALHYFPFEPP